MPRYPYRSMPLISLMLEVHDGAWMVREDCCKTAFHSARCCRYRKGLPRGGHPSRRPAARFAVNSPTLQCYASSTRPLLTQSFTPAVYTAKIFFYFSLTVLSLSAFDPALGFYWIAKRLVCVLFVFSFFFVLRQDKEIGTFGKIWS